jgi:hypothetical protein
MANKVKFDVPQMSEEQTKECYDLIDKNLPAVIKRLLAIALFAKEMPAMAAIKEILARRLPITDESAGPITIEIKRRDLE